MSIYSGKKIYFNVSIPHDDSKSIMGSPTPAIYNTVRDEAIISEPSKYNMSVIRFTIPTATIPIQYFPVIYNNLNPLDPNHSAYTITLRYNNIDYTEHLVWIPQNKAVVIPYPPSLLPNVYNNPDYLLYYSLSSFSHFCSLINNALLNAFNMILPLLPPLPLGQEYHAPYLKFDGITFLFSWVVSDLFFEDNPNKIEIYFNTSLYNNFDVSFYNFFYGYNILDKNNRFIFDETLQNDTIVEITEDSGYLYKYTQEFDSSGLMTSFKSLIIRSGGLPVRNEGITTQSVKGGQISSGTRSILTDFEIDEGSFKNLKNYIHYTPTSEYRRIDMSSNVPLKQLSLEILWSDNYDNLYPLLIPSHEVATIKILFEEK